MAGNLCAESRGTLDDIVQCSMPEVAALAESTAKATCSKFVDRSATARALMWPAHWQTETEAQVHLQPPGPFNFRTPDDWPRWKRRFKQFRVTSGLSADSAKKQVNTLLYCIGKEAESVLTSTNITAREGEVYVSVIGKFDDFFKVRKNVIFQRARIN